MEQISTQLFICPYHIPFRWFCSMMKIIFSEKEHIQIYLPEIFFRTTSISIISFFSHRKFDAPLCYMRFFFIRWLQYSWGFSCNGRGQCIFCSTSYNFIVYITHSRLFNMEYANGLFAPFLSLSLSISLFLSWFYETSFFLVMFAKKNTPKWSKNKYF